MSEFAPGSTTPTATLSGLNNPYSLAFDSSGNLYVANSAGGSNTVSEFAASITPAPAGVVIRSSQPANQMSLGNSSTPVDGINLTNAELAQIQTTASGTITFGDSSQTGNITFTTATPATTAGASTVVLQSTTGPGQIILDDGNGAGTALDGNGGTISLTAGTGGIVSANANNTTFRDCHHGWHGDAQHDWLDRDRDDRPQRNRDGQPHPLCRRCQHGAADCRHRHDR